MNRLEELVILINHKKDKLKNQHGWITKEEGFRELRFEITTLLTLLDEYIKWKDDRDVGEILKGNSLK
jgi:hypothetical protein